MKVGLVCTEYPPHPHGGIGTFAAAFARGLVAAGHEATVIEVGPARATRTDHGVGIETLPASNVPKLGWLLNRRTVHQYVEQESAAGRFDVVEVPDFQGWLPFASAAANVVVRLHLSATGIAKAAGRSVSPTVRWCESRTLAAHRRWIPVSEHALRLTREAFPHVEPDASAVVYYPIAPPDSAEEAASALSPLPGRFILYAGTLSVRKGALTLAKAARDVLSAMPDLSLVYVGPEQQEPGEEIRAEILRALGPGLASRCHFLGRRTRSEVMVCMRAATVFAFPSMLETFGMVVAEAMLQRCAVVTNDMPPFREFVRDEQTGLLVLPGDVGALSAALNRMLTDDALRNRLSEAGRREVAERFSVERCVAESLTFYERCIQEHRVDVEARRQGRSIKSRAIAAVEGLAPAATERLRNRFAMRRYALRRVRGLTGDVVAGGPFRGMKYVSESRGSSLLPKLIGSYEAELHGDVESLLSAGGFDRIVDVGCAEGYYAVGLAMRVPGARVLAYDLDPTARQYCCKLAALNGVAERVDVRGKCTVQELREVVTNRSLVVMDCEGAELDLLKPDDVPGLVGSTILVELHDFIVPGVGAAVRERFSRTHNMTTRLVSDRSAAEFPQVAPLPRKVAQYAIDEGRPARQEWLVMTPKSAAGAR